MSLFDAIKQKLGFGHDDHPQDDPDRTPLPGGAESTLPSERPTAVDNATLAPGRPLGASPASPGRPVDVAAILDEKAAAHPQTLNWRTSIVDLLKLLDLDSSLEARRALARELGCPTERMDDSAEMNLWLHHEVMQRLTEHGGSVPDELRH